MARPKRFQAALVALLALTTSGCLGLGTAGGFVPSGQLGGELAGTESLEGVEFAVGSKSFTESLVLGKMAIVLLKSAGAEITDLTGIPGSTASRQAMIDGDIDGMWEYTGTGWIAYLEHTDPILDEAEQYDAVRDEDRKENGLDWLPPAPMNNTYGFAVTQEVAQKYGITTFSEIKKVPVAERTFCVEPELVNRPDGMTGLLKRYGMPLGSASGVPQENLKEFQTGAIYAATANGECNFGEVFTTDGRILALDLAVLEDDLSFFPKYNVSFVVREQQTEAHPEIAEIFTPVAAKLTDETMTKLNARVDVDGEAPAEVAYEWLVEEGFVEDER